MIDHADEVSHWVAGEIVACSNPKVCKILYTEPLVNGTAIERMIDHADEVSHWVTCSNPKVCKILYKEPLVSKHRLWVRVRTAVLTGSNEYPRSLF